MIYRNEGSEEQYEGGRSSNRREEREYMESGEAHRRDDEEESQSAKVAMKLVQSELKRRGAVSEHRSSRHSSSSSP